MEQVKEARRMKMWARERWEYLWETEAVWQTGPLLVAEEVSIDVFRYLTESTSSRKMNLLFVEKDGSTGDLYITGDGSHLHECARDTLVLAIHQAMVGMGFRVQGSNPNILVLRGGRVEFPGFEKQLDLAIYEFRPGLSSDFALTPLVTEVVYLNESREYMEDMLVKMCETPGTTTLVAIGFFFPLLKKEERLRFEVVLKKRGSDLEKFEVQDGVTDELKIELEVRDLFTFPDAKEVARPGQKLVIDCKELAEILAWTRRDPLAAPGYRNVLV